MERAKYRAYLCCGPNCGPKGSVALVDFLAAEVDRRGLEREVAVAATGCQAHCESGPTMVVYPGPTYYQAVDQERLVRIVVEHFMGGVPVQEYFWTGVRRRIIPGAKTPSRPLPMPSQTFTNREVNRDKPKPNRPALDVDDFKW